MGEEWDLGFTVGFMGLRAWGCKDLIRVEAVTRFFGVQGL